MLRRSRIVSIELKNVSQKYDQEEALLKDISFTVPLGQNVVFQGPVGSGKSILLKIMAGLKEPTQGEILYNSIPLSQVSFEEFTPLRLSTSFCFDSGGLLNNKSILENLKLPLIYHGQWRNGRGDSLMNSLIQDFNLGNFLHLRPASVSAGVRKLAGLARSFLTNAQVLFLDEPSLSIGEEGVQALQFWLEKYRRERKSDDTLIIASSHKGFVDSLDAKRYRVENGGLILSPSIKDVA